MKRIALFVLTNLAIMVVLVLTLTVLSAVFGINFNLGGRSLNVASLAIFSLVVGFTGAFVSLLMSKPMAKWTTGAQSRIVAMSFCEPRSCRLQLSS